MRLPLSLLGDGHSFRLLGMGRRRCDIALVAAATTVTVFVLAGVAFAQPPNDPKQNQPPPPAEQPKTEGADKPAVPPAAPVTDVPPPKPACGDQGIVPGWAERMEAFEKSSQEAKRSTDASPGKEGGPRWVCERPIIVVQPVWSGEALVCDFPIRNEGTEDLVIKARGG